mgnify:CR=1 FL=1
MSTNIIETPKVLFSGKILQWEVVNKDGSIDKACYNPSSNMILDCGLDMIGDGALYDWTGLFQGLAVFVIGTGENLPQTTDTILGNESYRGTCSYAAYDGFDASVTGSDPFYHNWYRGVQTPLGAINGSFTEIGFSNSGTTNQPLFSKFRIVDEEGTPTSIPVSSEQQLRLRYVLSMQITPVLPAAGSTTITGIGAVGYTACFQGSGVLYHLLGLFSPKTDHWCPRAFLCDAAGFSFRSYQTAYNYWDLGNTAENSTKSVEAYVLGSHELYRNFKWDVTVANWSNSLFILTSYGMYAYWIAKFDTPIIKVNTHSLSLRLKLSWGRVS